MKKRSLNGFGIVLSAGILLMGGCSVESVHEENFEQEVNNKQAENPQTGADEPSVAAVQEEVQERYMDEDGLIHAYPEKKDSEYLSESISLYMRYLLVVEDEETFAEQYDNLLDHFIVEEGDSYFVRWLLFKNANVNAVIDDVRLAAVLNEASELFDEPEYKELADRISSTISNVQEVNGYTVDYYDWSIDMPAKRVTLSYLINDLPEALQEKKVLEEVDETAVFFPEYFDVENEEYIANDEVHMIDQLLIAINRSHIGQSSDSFEQWIKTEWKEKGKVVGRYDRESQEATVSYESLAVYYFLNSYFLKIDDKELADEVKRYVEQMVADNSLAETHFFDYIHYQLLMENYSE